MAAILLEVLGITDAATTLLDSLSILPFVYAGAMFAIVGVAIKQFKKVTK